GDLGSGPLSDRLRCEDGCCLLCKVVEVVAAGRQGAQPRKLRTELRATPDRVMHDLDQNLPHFERRRVRQKRWLKGTLQLGWTLLVEKIADFLFQCVPFLANAGAGW